MMAEPKYQHSSIGVDRPYLARFEGHWYIGHWDGVRLNVVLDKSPLMPGEGFGPSEPELQYCRRMSRVVPKTLVEVVPVLRYRGIPVGIIGLDPSSETLKLRLCRTNGYGYGEERVDLSCLGRDGWNIPDPKDQVWFSPYIDINDPRLEKVIGEIR